MTATRRQILASGAALAMAAAAPAVAEGVAAGAVRDPRLSALLDDFVEAWLADSPERATSLGLDRGPRAALRSQLDDRSRAARLNQLAAYAERARRLRTIPRDGLRDHDLTLYDTVLYALDRGAEGARFTYGRDNGNPYVVSQQDGMVATASEFLNAYHPIETQDDADAYIARLEQFGDRLDQETDQIRDAAGKGVVLPNFLLATTLRQCAVLRGQEPGATRLVNSLVGRAAARGIQADYQARATAIVAQKVFPALDHQIAALQKAQLKATHDAGVWKFKDGADYYRWALKLNTTTEHTPAEAHRFGLDQGAEIDAMMDGILKAQGYSQGTVGERMGALTNDPKFLYPDTEQGRREVLAFIEGRIAAIRPFLPRLSRLDLKAPVQVKAVPKEIEAGAGLGFTSFAALDGSRPAIYYVNLHDIRNWPKHTLASLTMHEALPGHAWHGAYLAERHDQTHPISSMIGFGAFSEGWALYAEQLADEAGLYVDDPMSRLGYLQALRFRAARLVVDTGIHHERWTRDTSIAWMVAATGRSAPAITSEIDRYCVIPGQACAYKIGHNEIVRLREKARAALGARFDIRHYNDEVIMTGGCPMAVLERVVDRYIATERGA